MQVYEIQSGRGGPDSLILADHPEPMLQAGQVLVKMHAAALNYRDLQVLRGTYGVQPTVPLSDGAGEIVATAKDVTRWQVGDRVTGIFRQTFISGELTPENAASALGGETNGVLAEFKAFDQQGLVKIPDHLSYEEAATLPCAAVTAWNALITEGHLKAGETVLRLRIQGLSVGSRDSFEEMNRAIVQQKMRPIIDRVFPFKEAKAAMAYLERGAHFGKVVVTI
jgi:NADPH:quinone reductase-like Zn-dependent oxidoreductase